MRSLRMVLATVLVAISSLCGAQTQFELENNWLMWISFISGHDEGIVQNLDDNFT